MEYSLEHRHKEEILDEIVLILNKRDEIVLAYVFGSFIDPDIFSDIDIGVLTVGNIKSPLKYEFELEIEIEDRIGYPIDVRILNNAPLSFCQNVIRHGRIILEKDANLTAEFMGQTLKKYFDFAPFRRKYLEEVANAPI
jgi:uncharacterized protein